MRGGAKHRHSRRFSFPTKFFGRVPKEGASLHSKAPDPMSAGSARDITGRSENPLPTTDSNIRYSQKATGQHERSCALASPRESSAAVLSPGPIIGKLGQKGTSGVAVEEKELPLPKEQPQAQHQPPSHVDTEMSGTENPTAGLNAAAPTVAMIRQPETRPISQEQLVAEVKGIYAGLVMVESKCIEVDNNQSQKKPGQSLSHEQWQALIALHRTLLHEHHDFFLASQHPSASPALRRLASKYAMPARMWRHGIHSFLELLRHRLPLSLEHMLTFIYLAYSMMALLYETVPAFADTWIECLGDLGRYRMAIEDDDIRDREVWTGVSRHWYSKASDNAPETGRLYHHLAILARPNALQQLYYYCKSLAVPTPFKSAKESILTLFDPVLNGDQRQHIRMSVSDLDFVHIMACLFTRKNVEKLGPLSNNFILNLNGHIARSTRRFMESGYYIAISQGCSLIGFGLDESDDRGDNVLLPLIQEEEAASEDEMRDALVPPSELPEMFLFARNFMGRTLKVVLSRRSDSNILPFVHVYSLMFWYFSHFPQALEILAPSIPWEDYAEILNDLILERPDIDTDRVFRDSIPVPIKSDKADPLPEDWATRGWLLAKGYHPEGFFPAQTEDDDKYFELPSMSEIRGERILSLGWRVAHTEAGKQYLVYDKQDRVFQAGPWCASKDPLSHIPRGQGTARSETEGTDSSFSTAFLATPSTSEDEEMGPV